MKLTTITNKEMQKTDKNTEKCLSSLVIKKVKIKIVKYHFWL